MTGSSKLCFGISIIFIAVPSITVVACYIKIYQTIRQHNTAAAPSSQQRLSSYGVEEAKITRMLTVVVVGFYLCWLPSLISNLSLALDLLGVTDIKYWNFYHTFHFLLAVFSILWLMQQWVNHSETSFWKYSVGNLIVDLKKITQGFQNEWDFFAAVMVSPWMTLTILLLLIFTIVRTAISLAFMVCFWAKREVFSCFLFIKNVPKFWNENWCCLSQVYAHLTEALKRISSFCRKSKAKLQCWQYLS